MRVRLLNNTFHEVDEIDVAYLYQQTRLTCAAIQSESIFTMFEAYIKRHSLDYDPEPIDEWDGNFIEQFTSIEMLQHLIMLAQRTSQAALLELCHQRFAQLPVSDSDSDSDSYGDDSDNNNDDGSNNGGDDSDHSNDYGGNSGGDDSDQNNGDSGGDISDHNSDDGSNSGEDNSDGDDSDHSNDYDSNSGNASDEVDDTGNQVEDFSHEELSVCGSDDAGNLSVEVSSGSSDDMNDLSPEVSNDSGSGKADNNDSSSGMVLVNGAGREAAVFKRISDEGGNKDEDEKGRI